MPGDEAFAFAFPITKLPASFDFETYFVAAFAIATFSCFQLKFDYLSRRDGKFHRRLPDIIKSNMASIRKCS
jgi:hypothetical protein